MKQSWKTVRIFISSTFRDMHAERDHLVKVVFSELRERCVKHKLHLIDVDLRWGVTEEEAEQGKVLETILEEIERSRPFFICILGERYGSIPDYIPDDARFSYPWLENYPDHSFTALEIVHGVLRNPELAKRSFFYFRNPEFISKVPENLSKNFISESSETALKLVALKDKILSSGRPVMKNYPCQWDTDKRSIVDLDIFGQRVLEDLWTAISEEYPEDANEPDPLYIERQMHEAFVEERSHLHVGHIKEAAQLTEYVQGKDNQPVVIAGESGSGKSAFLATWYRQYSAAYPDDYVLAYFIGASPDSTDHMQLLRNMCKELMYHFNLEENLPEDDKKLSETLTSLLISASQSRRIVILLDAIDQLSAKEEVCGMGWLLDYLPADVHLVVSSLEGDILDALRRRGDKEIKLKPLTKDEQLQIVESQLKEWGRRLDKKQISALLAHPEVDKPLYLRVALEELRLFGNFDELSAKIENLAPDIPRIFEQVLERLEKDHGYELITEVFSLIKCSRYGLGENELLELLRREDKDQFPRALWISLARSAKAYLVQRGELIGFFHSQLADAVAARYLPHEDKHVKLAAYFSQASAERRLDEYPYQLQHAEKWESLASALSDLDFFEYSWSKGKKYEWIGYWQSLQGYYKPETCYKRAIEIMQRIEGKTINVASISNIIGLLLHEMALYPAAILFNELALEISEKAFGSNNPNVSVSINNLAGLYHSQGRYSEAEHLYVRALRISENFFGSNHLEVAIPLNNLAGLYSSLGRYSEAESHYKQSLEIREKNLEPNHPDIATSLNNLALLYKFQGRYSEAEPLYKKAIEISENVHGYSHPNVATSFNNLATLYDSQGKYSQAEPLYKRALSIREKVFGRNHPEVAASLNSIAAHFYFEGSYPQAESFYKQAIGILKKILSPDHPDIATSLNNLATLYYSEGRYPETELLYKQAIEIREKALGLNHPEVATSLNNLAELYKSQGKYPVAEPLYKRALAINERVFGLNHPNVATSLNNLAELYRLQSRYPEAEPLYKQTLEIREKVLGLNHPDVASSFNNLALLYCSEGKYSEAETLYRKALTILKNVFEPNHPNIAALLNNLALLYYSEKRYPEAKPLYEQALEIREKVLGDCHPDVAITMYNLATLYYAESKYLEAESFYKKAIEVGKKALGPDHPYIATFLSNLAALYYSKSKYSEAESFYKMALAISKKSLGPDHPFTKTFRNNLRACKEAMR